MRHSCSNFTGCKLGNRRCFTDRHARVLHHGSLWHGHQHWGLWIFGFHQFLFERWKSVTSKLPREQRNNEVIVSHLPGEESSRLDFHLHPGENLLLALAWKLKKRESLRRQRRYPFAMCGTWLITVLLITWSWARCKASAAMPTP